MPSTTDLPTTTAQPALRHSAFYRFVALPDAPAVVARLNTLCQGLQGSILVAQEGINGTVAGPEAAVAGFETALLADPLLGERLAGMVFKHSACVQPPFGRMKVHLKREIVALGLPAGIADPVMQPQPPGSLLSPAEWRQLLTEDDVVVIDNRNHFEYRLGHFKGALDPQLQHFRDFPAFVQAHATGWKASGQRVAMYCTGGIRCEKTAAWMAQHHGLQVLQLDGGILNHFQSLPDAERDWQGECFVFDKRIALDTRLQPTGTTAEQVYADLPDGPWRLARALRLAEAG